MRDNNEAELYGKVYCNNTPSLNRLFSLLVASSLDPIEHELLVLVL